MQGSRAMQWELHDMNTWTLVTMHQADEEATILGGEDTARRCLSWNPMVSSSKCNQVSVWHNRTETNGAERSAAHRKGIELQRLGQLSVLPSLWTLRKLQPKRSCLEPFDFIRFPYVLCLDVCVKQELELMQFLLDCPLLSKPCSVSKVVMSTQMQRRPLNSTMYPSPSFPPTSCCSNSPGYTTWNAGNTSSQRSWGEQVCYGPRGPRWCKYNTWYDVRCRPVRNVQI